MTIQMTRNTIQMVRRAPESGLPKLAPKWLGQSMKKTSGRENRVLTLLARPARLAAAGAAGSASPPSETVTDEPMAICCAGQMTIHTLAAIVVPSTKPIAMPMPDADRQ